MATEAEWERIRDGLRFGQVVTGSVVRVPRPGAGEADGGRRA
ncbi:hypothetical protein [Streptomyces decoyicus]